MTPWNRHRLLRAYARIAISLIKSLDAQLTQRSEIYRIGRYDVQNRDDFDALWPHEEMLSSAVRMEAYRHAIETSIQPGSRVMDFGTGVGILAIWASKLAYHVDAIDHSKTMIKIASQLASLNNVRNITFHHTHSTQFLPKEPVDAIIHEQMGSWLTDELLVPNIVDLRDRVLRPTGSILPNQFSLYIEPIELQDAWRVPFLSEIPIKDVNTSGIHHSGHSVHSTKKYRNVPYSAVSRLVGYPEPVWQFDLETISSASLRIQPSWVDVQRIALHDVQVDGLAVWFSAGSRGRPWFDTSPTTAQIPWPIPIVRTRSRRLKRGESICYRVRPSYTDRATIECMP